MNDNAHLMILTITLQFEIRIFQYSGFQKTVNGLYRLERLSYQNPIGFNIY